MEETNNVFVAASGPTFFPTGRPSSSPTTFPSVSPTLFPTASPTFGDIHDFDLSEDAYEVSRILIVIFSSVLFHVVAYAILYRVRGGKPFHVTPKKAAISALDKNRHIAAQIFVLVGSLVSWAIAIATTSSCQFARVGEKEVFKRDRVAFGLFRSMSEVGLCEPMVIDDPARALILARTFGVYTCCVLGLAFILFAILEIIPLLPWESLHQRFHRRRLYGLWIVTISITYAAVWSNSFTFFLFGLRICVPHNNSETTCTKGSAKLAIFNTFLIFATVVVAMWYVWDALTPRSLTQEARQNSLRVNPQKNNNPVASPPNTPRRGKRPSTYDAEGSTERGEDFHDDNFVPMSPKLPAHKNSVRNELLEKMNSPKPKSPRKSPRTTPKGSRQIPVSGVSPAPNSARSTRGGRRSSQGGAPSSAPRTPRTPKTPRTTTPGGSRPSTSGQGMKKPMIPDLDDDSFHGASPAPKRGLPRRGSSRRMPN